MFNKGLTLIELLAAMAIACILVTLSVSSGLNYFQKVRLAQAQTDLLMLSSKMETHRAFNYNYKGAALGEKDTGYPAIYSHYSPAHVGPEKAHYDLVISSLGRGGYTYQLQARPKLGSGQRDLGNLFYFSDGRKAWDKNNDGVLSDSEYCWSC